MGSAFHFGPDDQVTRFDFNFVFSPSLDSEHNVTIKRWFTNI